MDGSEVTGSIATQSLSAGSTTVAAGNYSATTLTAVDGDLASGNIRASTTIFGVLGATNVVDTISGDAVAGELATGKKAWVDGVEITGNVAPSPVGETGQTTCWDASGSGIDCAGTGQDGDLRPGVVWPNPRFTAHDGTVTDHLTGLIWLQDANCFGSQTWATALNDANTLANGTCGLNDSSLAGDWRLPSLFELFSLIDLKFSDPALSDAAGTGKWPMNNPFANVQASEYWSSSNSAGGLSLAWVVAFSTGYVYFVSKSNTPFVWPVRGGQ